MVHPDRLEKQFRQLVEDDTLSHSYLFVGKYGDAPYMFAKKVASYLETDSFEVAARPLNDTIMLTPDVQGTLGIEAVRGLKNFLMSRPAVGKRRVAIIERAESLTPQAQNALLKIAEEPPAKALLILVTKSAEALLPTVLSRFQKIFLGEERESRAPASAPSLVKEFLRANSGRRSALIKTMLEDPETAHAAVNTFLDGLILELHKDMPRTHRTVGFVLRRKKLMEEWNTNPRLQLEVIAKMV